MLASVAQQLTTSENDRTLGHRIQNLLKRKVIKIKLGFGIFFPETN